MCWVKMYRLGCWSKSCGVWKAHSRDGRRDRILQRGKCAPEGKELALVSYCDPWAWNPFGFSLGIEPTWSNQGCFRQTEQLWIFMPLERRKGRKMRRRRRLTGRGKGGGEEVKEKEAGRCEIPSPHVHVYSRNLVLCSVVHSPRRKPSLSQVGF